MLPLYVGVPAGGVLVLVILAVFLLQNRNRCGGSRRDLKRHRLPVPTHEPRADSAGPLPPSSAGFYSGFHPSPTTTNTVGGTVTTANTLTSGGGGGSNALNLPGGSLHGGSVGGHINYGTGVPGLAGVGKMPKTPAPSIDFGSDISSVSHSQSHPQQPPYGFEGQQHFLNPHVSYPYWDTMDK
jgi:hypothetical protein